MYKALVIVCSLFTGRTLLNFKTSGAVPTKELCEERVKKMSGYTSVPKLFHHRTRIRTSAK